MPGIRAPLPSPHALRPALALLLLGLAGCASEPEDLSAPEMLAEANSLADAADYQGAVEMYSEIQAVHPFSPFAQQSLLNLAHLHYTNREFEEAIKALDRFIRDYASHPRLDYARYLRAICLSRDRTDLLERLILANAGTNSNADLIRAHEAFNELIRLHPDSVYIPDAIDRGNEIVARIAASELESAIHYLRLGAYSASLRRSADVIASFPNSSVTETALAVMIASLAEINSDKPLADAITSLESSFPGSKLLEPAQRGAVALLEHLEVEIEPGDYFTRLLIKRVPADGS